ncbi:MAG TPA: M50 family metallopeptidase [Acidimicrobiales bacterium]|nr:M50 family metallopeptidase [Acidimicrobiales bacterium]
MTDLHQRQPATPPPPPGRKADQAEGSSPWRLAILAGLVAWLGIAGGWAPLVVVLGVVLMIFLHELGHYLAARWGGMKVTEFFIGFGPKIWSFRRGETEYGLKVIPAGAYVKVIGMNNLDEVPPEDEARTYRQATYPRRMAVAVAGSTMHFLQALLLLFVLYAFVGVPGGSLTEDKEWEVAEVVRGSAAADAGLEEGDRVLLLDGVEHETFTEFAETISEQPGEDVLLVVERDGRTFEVPVEVGRNPDEPRLGMLGIRRDLVTTTVGPVRAVGAAAGDFWDQTTATLGFIGSFNPVEFIGDIADGQDDSTQVEVPTSGGGGPEVTESPDDGRIISIVGAVRIGADLTENGLLGFLLFFVGINITIGIFNLLPVLPLDGGHVVIATYERIREALRPGRERYHVDMAKLLPVVYAVFVLLVMLGVTTIYLDLIDPVSL